MPTSGESCESVPPPGASNYVSCQDRRPLGSAASRSGLNARAVEAVADGRGLDAEPRPTRVSDAPSAYRWAGAASVSSSDFVDVAGRLAFRRVRRVMTVVR